MKHSISYNKQEYMADKKNFNYFLIAVVQGIYFTKSFAFLKNIKCNKLYMHGTRVSLKTLCNLNYIRFNMSNKIGPKNIIYSPILVSVYDRLEHFQRCISSLKDDEAKKSELFIASDVKDKSSNYSVKKIRAYASRITGFRKII